MNRGTRTVALVLVVVLVVSLLASMVLPYLAMADRSAAENRGGSFFVPRGGPFLLLRFF